MRAPAGRNLYVPPSYPWAVGPGVYDPGLSVPRINAENEAYMPRTWPVIYSVPCMGLGAQAFLPRGYADPVFNNQTVGTQQGYFVQLPGLSKLPYGG
jgi:hypothetical protein